MKIYIFGGPTTGKTTFSKKLSKKYNIKYLPLDKIIFKKGNIRRKETIRKKMLTNYIQKIDWIIEGGSIGWCDDLFSKSDMVIYLEIPIYEALIRIIKRHIRDRKFSLLSTIRLCFILLPRYYTKYIRNYAESRGAKNVVVIKNPTLTDLVNKIKIFYDN